MMRTWLIGSLLSRHHQHQRKPQYCPQAGLEHKMFVRSAMLCQPLIHVENARNMCVICVVTVIESWKWSGGVHSALTTRVSQHRGLFEKATMTQQMMEKNRMLLS
jgi:hypothetical protein